MILVSSSYKCQMPFTATFKVVVVVGIKDDPQETRNNSLENVEEMFAIIK